MPSQFSRLVRKAEVLQVVGVNISTLLRWIADGRFPKPVILNEGTQGPEIVCWRESDLEAWFAALPERIGKAQKQTRKSVREVRPSE